jgi:hypothetical protein
MATAGRSNGRECLRRTESTAIRTELCLCLAQLCLAPAAAGLLSDC